MNPTWEPPEDWGNPLLSEFQEIALSEPVSFLPATKAWWWLAGAVILWLVYRGYRVFERWRRNRYRREAVAWLREAVSRINRDELLQQLPVLLKVTAMHAYGRERVASLEGSAWLGFLRRHGPQDCFTEEIGAALLEVAYADPAHWSDVSNQGGALIAAVETWIEHHVFPEDEPKPETEVKSHA